LVLELLGERVRRFGEVHCRFVVQDTLEISGADGTQTSLPLEDIDIVRMAKEDEGAFKPVGCTFRVTIEESEGVKVTHKSTKLAELFPKQRGILSHAVYRTVRLCKPAKTDFEA
jgi:hypothetical protein